MMMICVEKFRYFSFFKANVLRINVMTLRNGDDTIILEVTGSPPVIKMSLMIILWIVFGGLRVEVNWIPILAWWQMTRESTGMFNAAPSVLRAGAGSKTWCFAPKKKRKKRKEVERERSCERNWITKKRYNASKIDNAAGCKPLRSHSMLFLFLSLFFSLVYSNFGDGISAKRDVRNRFAPRYFLKMRVQKSRGPRLLNRFAKTTT